MLKLQYRPRVLQHLHACKLRAVWRIYTQNTRKKHACKILHEQLHARCVYLSLEKLPFLLLRASCKVSLKGWGWIRCPDFPVTSCREKLQKNFVIKQVKLKSFGKKKDHLWAFKVLFTCGFLSLLCETFCWVRSFVPNLDEKSRLRIRDNTEANGIESGAGGGGGPVAAAL